MSDRAVGFLVAVELSALIWALVLVLAASAL
jgi:hypothetical protein